MIFHHFHYARRSVLIKNGRELEIAVIDDDEYISSFLSTLLEKNGYRVLKGYSGTEALLLIEKELPDLMLLDLMLPGLSGEEVVNYSDL